ncbi:MAG: transporter [Nitrospinae bacterium]|nr:transporter [Nitrospinota bacterium]
MLIKRLSFIFIFMLGFCALGLHSAEGIPINSDVGLTPHKGEFIFRVQARYLRKSDDPLNQGRSVDEVVVPFVGVYGFTSKSSILVKVPYIYRELKTASGALRSDQGPGDVTILGKHRFFTHNFKGGTSRSSVIAGLELPTGDDNARDSLGLLPKGIQLGSGSVDFIAGGTYTLQTLDNQFDMDLRYIFNREANNFEFGDVFKYNLAYQKRIWPSILPDKGIYSQWNAVLELNGVLERRSELGGNEVASSGGNTIFLSPGIQFVSKRSVYEFSFLYPVVQNLNGSQLETDYSLALSFRYIY